MRVPLFSLTYCVTGALVILGEFLRLRRQALFFLGAMILIVSGFNAYIEKWNSTYAPTFVKFAFALVFGFITFHGEFSVALLRQSIVVPRRHLYSIAFVPINWMLGASVLFLLPRFQDAENPPLVVYTFVVFICVLHVPAFLAGREKALKATEGALEPRTSASSFPLQIAFAALLVPTAISLFVQLATSDDWTIFSLNAIFAGANLALVMISRPRVAHSTEPPRN